MSIKFYLFSVLVLILNATSSAQQPCGLDEMTERWIQEDNARADELMRFDSEISKLSTQQATNRAVIIIPVVVHVIHKGESIGSGTNVSESRIASQLNILNDDFQRMNSDASQTPGQFAAVAANAGIIFCLANVDPFGNPTTAITRHQYTNIPDETYIENTIKPATTWNSDRYLNVWVVDIPDPSYLGYSYLPTSTMVGSDRDGLVLDYNRFGFISNSNKGRTGTHEIGHYLGLRHMWGSNNSNGSPIGCSSDDNISDTPGSDGPYFGCPNSGSSCGSSDMYMNYMDYVDDDCMNLFTQGQANVMQGILNGIRSDLITNNITSCSQDCKDLEAADILHGFEPSQSNSDWVVVNANGDDRTWTILNDSDTDWGPNQGSGMAIYFWNADEAANDYLFTPCFSMKKNHKYEISFSYACAEDENSLYPEKFRVGISNAQSSSDFQVPNNDWVFSPVTNAYPNYQDAKLSFVATEDATSSFGFHINSDADQYALQLDDIKIVDSGSVAVDGPGPEEVLAVHPNPTSGRVFITPPSNLEANSTVYLYGMNGQLLRSWTHENRLEIMEISFFELPAGVFVLKWADSMNQWTTRIVKIETDQ